MRIAGVVALLVVIGARPPAAAADAGFFVPPMRMDVSPTAMTGAHGAVPGFHFLTGMHWASLWPGKRTPVDVGIGYLYEVYDLEVGSRSALLAAGMEPRPERLMELHGCYLELARRAGGNGFRRGWIGARAELLFGEVDGRTRAGVAFTGRAAWELFAPVKAGGRGGVIVGTFALGMYLELGGRRLPDGTDALQSTAGLSMRLPLIAIGG